MVSYWPESIKIINVFANREEAVWRINLLVSNSKLAHELFLVMIVCRLSICRFVNYNDKSGLASDKPSEFVLKKAFSTFGEVRIVDIPMLDPYRSWITIFLYSINHLPFHRHKMKKGVAGIKTFSFGQDLVFDAFIQFKVNNSLLLFSKIKKYKFSGVHRLCQVHERHEGYEAVLQGPR